MRDHRSRAVHIFAFANEADRGSRRLGFDIRGRQAQPGQRIARECADNSTSRRERDHVVQGKMAAARVVHERTRTGSDCEYSQCKYLTHGFVRSEF